jgi:ATP-dependent DNA helicase RecQ
MNVLNHRSTMFVSETGSGKSLSYILSAILQEGLAIVISPLISLMLDQIESIPEILPAACITSLLNREQKNRIINMVK